MVGILTGLRTITQIHRIRQGFKGVGDVVHVGNFIHRINEDGDAGGNVGAQFRQPHHSDRLQNGPVHVGARVDHGDFRLGDAAENLDEFPLGFLSGFNEIHNAGVGRAQGAVEGVEIAAFPGNASLTHPLAARNGLGGLAKVAACLDGHDEPVLSLKCCRVFAWFHGVLWLMAA